MTSLPTPARQGFSMTKKGMLLDCFLSSRVLGRNLRTDTDGWEPADCFLATLVAMTPAPSREEKRRGSGRGGLGAAPAAPSPLNRLPGVIANEGLFRPSEAICWLDTGYSMLVACSWLLVQDYRFPLPSSFREGGGAR